VFDVVNEGRPATTSCVEAIEVVGASPSRQNRLPDAFCVLIFGQPVPSLGFVFMSRVVKRSALQANKADPSRAARSRSASPLPRFIPLQLSLPVEKPPWGLGGCMKSN
jgi:hypothetical protein